MVQASTALGAVTYQLNALGQRYAKTLQGTTTVFLYDRSGRLIAETSDAGATYTQYVWLGDTPVAVLKPNTPTPARYYVHSDHLDTPRVITDQAQALRWRWDNDDPFGANMAADNPSGLGTFAFNLRFPGQYFDKETNNHYNYYRDYSPETGRYIESDPIGLWGGINTYAYVDGNPVRMYDDKGHYGQVIVAGGIVVAGFGAYKLINFFSNLYQFYQASALVASSQATLSSATQACQSYPQGNACNALPGLRIQLFQCQVAQAQFGTAVSYGDPTSSIPSKPIMPGDKFFLR